jgi:hypothetical protein
MGYDPSGDGARLSTGLGESDSRIPRHDSPLKNAVGPVYMTGSYSVDMDKLVKSPASQAGNA